MTRGSLQVLWGSPGCPPYMGALCIKAIVKLQDIGIPVEGERGSDGPYQLRRGYKLTPLRSRAGTGCAQTPAQAAVRDWSARWCCARPQNHQAAPAPYPQPRLPFLFAI